MQYQALSAFYGEIRSYETGRCALDTKFHFLYLLCFRGISAEVCTEKNNIIHYIISQSPSFFNSSFLICHYIFPILFCAKLRVFGENHSNERL